LPAGRDNDEHEQRLGTRHSDGERYNGGFDNDDLDGEHTNDGGSRGNQQSGSDGSEGLEEGSEGLEEGSDGSEEGSEGSASNEGDSGTDDDEY
jgi:hypothetical protein